MSRLASQWHIRWATQADTPALRALFERAFATPSSAEQWAWKYRHASSPGVVCCHGETLIAFNGGMPRQARVFGEDHGVVQMGDVMVDPEWRGVLTRRGPFYRVVHAYFADCVGEGLPYRHAFGFPHARHARLGRKLGLYCDTDRILEAHWPTLATRRWAESARPLFERDATTVDTLWQAMAADASQVAMGQRDWHWMRHRYITHPHQAYQAWLVTTRLSRRPLGVVVLAPRDAQTLELVDLVGPRASMRRLVEVARHIGARLGASRLFGWLTPSSAAWLDDTQPQLTPTEVVVPGSQVNGLELGLELEDRWWLMGGDSDFR